ncbi:MAG: hypothetical protein AMXMBFR58_03620 [Phycisphaerae bacterium]
MMHGAKNKADGTGPVRHGRRPGLVALAASLAFLGVAALPASGQQKTYKVDEDGQWTVSKAPEAGSDAEIIGRAREMMAQGRYSAAEALMDGWIERNERTSNPWLAEAYLARGDARLMRDREVPALEDYEEIVKNFPGSEAYVLALTRELEVGLLYLNGKKKKVFGIRIEPAERIGEEIVLRVSERLPRSRLAERALMELADYYYRVRDMDMAAETYEVFLRLFPTSEQRQRAMQRRVYANIAKFKGPEYDASGLREARFLIEDYKARYPQDAERIGMDDALIARLDESAAAQLLETAKWFLRRKDEVSARLTVSRLLRRHPGTVAAVRAQEMIDERGWKMPEPKRAVVDEPPADDAAPAEDAKTPAAPDAAAPTEAEKQPESGAGVDR